MKANFAFFVIGVLFTFLPLFQSQCVFTYDPEDNTGPQHWGTICDKRYPECAMDFQSPIDIPLDSKNKSFPNPHYQSGYLHGLDLNYGKEEVTVLQFDSLMKISMDYESGKLKGGLSKTVGVTKKVRFHTPSEHTIDGRQYDLELQIIHELEGEKKGKIAIVSILVEGVENHNPVFDTMILSGIPNAAEEFSRAFEVSLKEALPRTNSYYYYNGSLTTPPCTRNVEWYVMMQPIQATFAQIDHFRQSVSDPVWGNARPIQKRHERKIYFFADQHARYSIVAVSILSAFALFIILLLLGACVKSLIFRSIKDSATSVENERIYSGDQLRYT